MILFGNVFGGVFVILLHLIVVTNIDNFLRPILVPREARLDSALMLLAVFAGIAMFGVLGHRHRPGADDRHRHDDQRLPGGVQGRPDGSA